MVWFLSTRAGPSSRSGFREEGPVVGVLCRLASVQQGPDVLDTAVGDVAAGHAAVAVTGSTRG